MPVSSIYLDYNATTPLDPAVIEAMLPYLRELFGNPSSAHSYGKTAHDAVEQARRQVAELLNARPDEIVFTGGGSEASNLALKGVAFARLRRLFGRWAQRAAHRHQRHGTPGHDATVRVSEAARMSRHRRAGGRPRLR